MEFAQIKARMRGVFTAIVTPFANGQVDVEALERLVEAQVKANVAGIVPVGTTGESATLNDAESDLVISTAVRVAGGRCFVLAGAGSNNTALAVKKAKRAQELGADGVLVVTPYYNKPSQRGLIEHFSAVASAINIPVMLYSVPGRASIEISPSTAAELAKKHSNVVAIKEAGGRADRVSDLRRAVGDDFIIHSGDDGLTLPFLSLGADGVTSVASNLIPEEIVALVDAWNSGDVEAARKMHYRVIDLVEHLFIESNPVPVKAAMAMQGLMSSEIRLPLVGLSEASEEALRGSLARFSAT